MTLIDRIKTGLTTSQSSTDVSAPANGATPTPAQTGGGAAALLEKHKQIGGERRGSKPGVPRGPYNKNKVDPAVPPPAPRVVYSPETGEHVQRAIFGALGVVSKRDAWFLEDREAKYLGPLTSECLNQFAPDNQKWVTLSLLAVSMLSVFSAKAQTVAAEVKAEKIEAARQANLRKSPATPPQGPASPGPGPAPSAPAPNIPPFITEVKQ